MNVTQEMVGPRQVVLRVEPDPQDVQNAMRKMARQVSRYRPLAGFRPGKAPYALVERQYGREFLLHEALNDMANQVYTEAIADQDLTPYAQGQFEIESEEPVVLKFTVSLTPEVKLGDYATIAIEREPEVAITQEQIDEAVEQTRRRHAQSEAVDRPAQMGDQIVASVSGKTEDEEVVNQDNATLDLNDELMPPGFAEALLGMSVDDTREFSLAYPEDYDAEDLAGKTVNFDVTIKIVRQITLPPVDDDLAKTDGRYETLEEMRAGLAESLKERAEAEARRRERELAVQTLVDLSTVEYPDVALDSEVESQVNRQRDMLQQMGFDLGNYLRMTGSSEEEFRAQLRPGAERNLMQRLVLTEYARAEQLQVTPEELNAHVQQLSNSLAMRYGDQADRVMRDLAKRGVGMSLYGDALIDKATDLLVAKSTGQYVEAGSVEPEDSAEADQDAVAAEALPESNETPESE